MRVGFAGTPEFAVRALASLHEAGHTIALVLTQPDRPHGRGLRLAPSPVKVYAQSVGLPVVQPASLRLHELRAPVLAVPLDVLVVAAYGLILPPEVLGWPRHGCLNIHASLLPRWRGAAPIARAIQAGDRSTGITIMQMDAGLDTGPIVSVDEVPIDPRETAGSLHDKLAAVGAAAIVRALDALRRDGGLASRPQPAEGATYAAKLTRDEAALDFTLSADLLERRIRALDPSPGAFTTHGGALVKVGPATVVQGTYDAQPGTVLRIGEEGIDVACGQATALRLDRLKPAGGRWMHAAAFAAGRALAPGERLGG
jgi:methionyl-tRNA formyltransferase